MEKILWGEKDGQEIYRFSIKNAQGMSATLMNYGANLLELFVPGRDNTFTDLALGFKDLESYYVNAPCFGCSVAPFANRIKDASFTLNGKKINLDPNEGNNCLHSGNAIPPFHHRIWDVKEHKEDHITFHLETSEDDSIMPGKFSLDITYRVTPDNMLEIEYAASNTEDTYYNPTNHSYFNLSGFSAGARPLLDSTLWVDADYFTPTDANSIPTGELADVTGTPMDFREPQALIKNVENFDFPPIKIGKGYDHNFVINNWDGTFKKVASLYDPRTFRTMEVFTDMPGIQIYTGNYLEPSPIGKNNTAFHPHDGIALETQYFPNCVNIDSFPKPLIKAGETFKSKTGYRFSVLDF